MLPRVDRVSTKDSLGLVGAATPGLIGTTGMQLAELTFNYGLLINSITSATVKVDKSCGQNSAQVAGCG